MLRQTTCVSLVTLWILDIKSHKSENSKLGLKKQSDIPLFLPWGQLHKELKKNLRTILVFEELIFWCVNFVVYATKISVSSTNFVFYNNKFFWPSFEGLLYLVKFNQFFFHDTKAHSTVYMMHKSSSLEVHLDCSCLYSCVYQICIYSDLKLDRIGWGGTSIDFYWSRLLVK